MDPRVLAVSANIWRRLSSARSFAFMFDPLCQASGLRLLLALLLAGAFTVETVARTAPARPANSALRIGGVEYVDVANFAAKLGMKFQAMAGAKTFLLQGPSG